MPLLGWVSILFTSWNVIMRWAFDLVFFASSIKWLPPTFPRRLWIRLGPQAFIRLFQVGIPTHASFIWKRPFWDGLWRTLRFFSFRRFYKWIPTIVSTLFPYRARSHPMSNCTYLWNNLPFCHDQAFWWSSSHCYGGNIILTHKSYFMFSILWCLYNTFFPTPIQSYNQK
jgi:hypothetical protein